MSNHDIIEKLISALLDQDRDLVNKYVGDALSAGVPPMEILNNGLSVGLKELGVLFSEEEVFLPELLLAANIVTEIIDKLSEKFETDDASLVKRGTVLLATVEGDVHDIGKSLVGMIMNASGYDVIDAGKDVANSKLIEIVKNKKPDIVGLSSLLATTMPAQKEFIEMAKESGIRDQIKIMVGGAPVSKEWAYKIGSDGWAEDASGAVLEADRMLGHAS